MASNVFSTPPCSGSSFCEALDVENGSKHYRARQQEGAGHHPQGDSQSPGAPATHRWSSSWPGIIRASAKLSALFGVNGLGRLAIEVLRGTANTRISTDEILALTSGEARATTRPPACKAA